MHDPIFPIFPFSHHYLLFTSATTTTTTVLFFILIILMLILLFYLMFFFFLIIIFIVIIIWIVIIIFNSSLMLTYLFLFCISICNEKKVFMQGPPVIRKTARDWGYWFFPSFIIHHIRGRCMIPYTENPPIPSLSYTEVRPFDSSLALLGMLAPLMLSSFLGSHHLSLLFRLTDTNHSH